MPLLNYTTKIDIFTTLGEIQSQLVKHGAKKILQEYNDEGDLYALSFSINTPYGMRGIKLPANVDAVQRVLEQQKKRSDREHAERVAWRILKDWIEAQMAILESQMVQFDQIFFPYITNEVGKTLYETYKASQLLTE
jgi:hypothetical protein